MADKKPQIKKNAGLDILILCQKQFGIHIDTFVYSKHLKKNHHVTFICWDYNLPRQDEKNIKIIYISRKGNVFERNKRYLSGAVEFLKSNPVDICLIKYFRGCSLLKLMFPHKSFVFDIRSGYCKSFPVYRAAYNVFMYFESIFFKHITVISDAVAKQFHLHKKATIIPLGSYRISEKTKRFESIRLIYAGSLSDRNIDHTIKGLAIFMDANPHLKSQVTYTIIGTGHNNELQELKELTARLRIKKYINIVGYIPFKKLKPHFDRHNVGVSYVPTVPFFDRQPVTKTFDYLLSGMPVIATATTGNKRIITPLNGILIKDSKIHFAKGIEAIYRKKNYFNSHAIMKASQKYHWKFITLKLEKYLIDIFNKSI